MAKKSVKEKLEISEDNVSDDSIGNSPAEIGRLIKGKREGKKLSLDDVVEVLKIRHTYIESMERGNFDQLPEGVYRKTYIKSYTEFLGLNYADIIQQMEASFVADNPPKDDVHVEPHRDEFKPTKLIIFLSIAAAVAAYFVWWDYKQKISVKSEPVIVAEKEVEKIVEFLTMESHELSLVAVKDVTFSLFDVDGKLLLEQTLVAGDVFFAPSKDGISLKIEDISALEFYLDSEKVLSTDGLVKGDNGFILDVNNLVANVEVQLNEQASP